MLRQRIGRIRTTISRSPPRTSARRPSCSRCRAGRCAACRHEPRADPARRELGLLPRPAHVARVQRPERPLGAAQVGLGGQRHDGGPVVVHLAEAFPDPRLILRVGGLCPARSRLRCWPGLVAERTRLEALQSGRVATADRSLRKPTSGAASIRTTCHRRHLAEKAPSFCPLLVLEAASHGLGAACASLSDSFVEKRRPA